MDNKTVRIVAVGVMHAPSIVFTLNGEYLCNGKVYSGRAEVCVEKGRIVYCGQEYDELVFSPLIKTEFYDSSVSFTLHSVVIGVDFHWQRKEDQSFKGDLKFIVSDGEVYAVNVIDVEAYLFSVISSEMSPHASLELLKAHAVISRSWLLAAMENGGSDVAPCTLIDGDEYVKYYERDAHTLFDVCADDHCQRYQGIIRINNDKPQKAIEATRGMVLRYGGKICDARYSKSCGGRSELFENCWADIHHPYLQSVECRKEGVEKHFCDTSDPKILAQVLNNYDQETLDFYKWEVKYGRTELSELIKRRSGIDFGMIQNLEPEERGASGRIVRLKIVGDKCTVVVGKELEIRKWLSESHLYSSNFTVEHSDAGFVFRGSGWGHGVGLCQIGAAVMAEEGYGYEEILKHYFVGVEIW